MNTAIANYQGESEAPMITRFHVWTGPDRDAGFLREHLGKVKLLFKECQCTKEELDSYALPVWSTDGKAVALQISGPVAQKARFAKLQGKSFIVDSFKVDLNAKSRAA